MPFIDVTAAQMLSALGEDLGRRHVELLLARDLGAVRDVLRASHVEDGTRVFATVQEAVDAAQRPPSAVAQSPTQGPRQAP